MKQSVFLKGAIAFLPIAMMSLSSLRANAQGEQFELLGTINYERGGPFGASENSTLTLNPPQDLEKIFFQPNCGQGVQVTAVFPRDMARDPQNPSIYYPLGGAGGNVSQVGVRGLNIQLGRREVCPVNVYGKKADRSQDFGEKICSGINRITSDQPFWRITFVDCVPTVPVKTLIVKSIGCVWGRDIYTGGQRRIGVGTIPNSYIRTAQGGIQEMREMGGMQRSGGTYIILTNLSNAPVDMAEFNLSVWNESTPNGITIAKSCRWEVYLPPNN